ncbi:MAG TPA: FAD-binding protein [Gemmatimonas sp.]|uniref:FAD-binding protein n=1 Tax=Gemmatimonas sp. TaxID=1962908 RepID=UPI002EDA10E1
MSHPTLRATSPASVDALAATVRAHHAAVQPMRFIGSGTWLQGGGPFVDATPVSLRGLAGIVEYTPGDLVITVGAGTTMRELSAITTEHGQMLALTPYGDTESTIGATIATASAAPLALDDLSVRDLVLGLTVITGTGAVTRVGGRVVKNVAGFDLVRLHTGAWGTLGAIAEVSLRLHAVPVHDVVLGGRLSAELGDAIPPLVANRAPIPMQVVLEPGEAPRLLARVSGNLARVDALRARLVQLGMQNPEALSPDDIAARRHTPDDAIVLRLRTALSDAVPFVRATRDAFPTASLTYSPHRGSLRVVLPTATSAGDAEDIMDGVTRALSTVARLATTFGASHAIAIALDQGRRQYPARTPLEAGIKRALDPDDLCNRVSAMDSAPAPLPV